MRCVRLGCHEKTKSDPGFDPNLRTEGAWGMKHRLDPTWVPDPAHPQEASLCLV